MVLSEYDDVDDVVRLEMLKVSDEPQSPVMHLYLASSTGSRDEDLTLLRRIVSLVSLINTNNVVFNGMWFEIQSTAYYIDC